MNFAKVFFIEHIRVSASDIRMQLVVIYDLNISLQFVLINFTFSFLLFFTLAYASMVPEFLHRFVFR